MERAQREGAKPRIIAVAGNMGAGKSSLVAWLEQQFDMVPFFEPNAENPYLADFYADMPRFAMSSQLKALVENPNDKPLESYKK